MTEIMRRPVLMTEKEVAALLRVSLETIRKKRLYGKPPSFYKIEGRVVYDEQDVLSYLESCKSVKK